MTTEIDTSSIILMEKSNEEPYTGTADLAETETADTTEETPPSQGLGTLAQPAVSRSKRTRPAYQYNANKITLRFLFANNDGITVTMECDPSDTVLAVKSSLVACWPDELASCTTEDQLRLVCMGKGYLSPDEKTLGEFDIPTFKTHPTPVNVSLRPVSNHSNAALKKKKGASASSDAASASARGASAARTSSGVEQGCSCSIL